MPWLMLLRKFWYAIPMLALTIALMLSNHHLSDARKVIQNEKDFRTTVMFRIGAKADDRETLYATIDARMTESANRAQALLQISTQAQTEHQHSVQADKQLAEAQAENSKRFSAAQSEINRLEHQKSTGNCAADLLQIGQDTQAPWKDWK